MPQDFWTIDIGLDAERGQFTARLSELNGDKLAKFTLKSAEEAEAARARAQAASWRVQDIESRPMSRRRRTTVYDLHFATGSRTQARLHRSAHDDVRAKTL